jgi:hypothetical protein
MARWKRRVNRHVCLQSTDRRQAVRAPSTSGGYDSRADADQVSLLRCRGLIDDGHEPWPRCPECDGSQYVPVVDKAEIAAARCRLLQEYPDAVSGNSDRD